jgi:hypothetical protein
MVKPYYGLSVSVNLETEFELFYILYAQVHHGEQEDPVISPCEHQWGCEAHSSQRHR